jgi:hypothetical protein
MLPRLLVNQFQFVRFQEDNIPSLKDWQIFQWTEEELAILMNEEIESDPTADELHLLKPGYEERILRGVASRITNNR